MSDNEDDIMSAFEQTFAVDSKLKAAAKPKNRKAAEKRHGLRHDDGRRRRATGRTAQLNLKLKPEYVTRIKETAEKHKILLAVLAERAFDLLFAELAAKGKKR